MGHKSDAQRHIPTQERDDVTEARANISDNTGTGVDEMASEGLRWQWRWLMQRDLSGADPKDLRRLPCQVCFAKTTTKLGTWRFEAIDWHDSYEARVELNGKHVVSKQNLCSRAEAQRCAEYLIIEFAKHILRVLVKA